MIVDVAPVLSLPKSLAIRNISITPLAYSIVSSWPETRPPAAHGGWNEPPWKLPLAGL